MNKFGQASESREFGLPLWQTIAHDPDCCAHAHGLKTTQEEHEQQSPELAQALASKVAAHQRN